MSIASMHCQYLGYVIPRSLAGGGRHTSSARYDVLLVRTSKDIARENAATSGRVIFFELAVQRRQTDIQNAGSELPIASMPPQCLCDRFSFNLG